MTEPKDSAPDASDQTEPIVVPGAVPEVAPVAVTGATNADAEAARAEAEAAADRKSVV